MVADIEETQGLVPAAITKSQNERTIHVDEQSRNNIIKYETSSRI